jgi:hypothetical protein
MSKKNGNGKKDAERLFTVTWEEQIVVSALIWPKSPKDAKEKAESRSFNDFVEPGGCFSETVPGSSAVVDEIEGAVKKNYKSGVKRYAAIYF